MLFFLSLEGDAVRVVEPDDGTGWVKVTNEHGRSGLVPASYLQHDVATAAAAAVPSQASGQSYRGGSGQYGNYYPGRV